MARAAPQLAIMAILVISVLLNSAFVATTPMVVLWKIRSSDPNALRRVARGGFVFNSSGDLKKTLPPGRRGAAGKLPVSPSPPPPTPLHDLIAPTPPQPVPKVSPPNPALILS